MLLRLSLYRQGWGHQKIPSFYEHTGLTTATKNMGQTGEETTGGRWMDDVRRSTDNVAAPRVIDAGWARTGVATGGSFPPARLERKDGWTGGSGS